MAKGASGTTICGWCMTGDHEHCQPSLKYYEKIWFCTCGQCHPEKEKKDEVVEELISQETETD